jgi:hypothetical protein
MKSLLTSPGGEGGIRKEYKYKAVQMGSFFFHGVANSLPDFVIQAGDSPVKQPFENR